MCWKHINELYERKEKLESDFHLFQRRMIRAFPTMHSVKISGEALLRIRERLQNYGKLIRRKQAQACGGPRHRTAIGAVFAPISRTRSAGASST